VSTKYVITPHHPKRLATSAHAETERHLHVKRHLEQRPPHMVQASHSSGGSSLRGSWASDSAIGASGCSEGYVITSSAMMRGALREEEFEPINPCSRATPPTIALRAIEEPESIAESTTAPLTALKTRSM